MPYIEKHLRSELKQQFIIPEEAGQINYAITKIIHRYIEKRGLCYATINEVIGVLECAKLELYRMIAAPYEDNKIADNGYVSKLDEGLNE